MHVLSMRNVHGLLRTVLQSEMSLWKYLMELCIQVYKLRVHAAVCKTRCINNIYR